MDKEEKELQPEEELHGKKAIKAKLEKKDEEIRSLHAQVDHWKNEYYRAYADTQNLRKSLEKDHMEAMKYRIEGFVDELLPILDSFHVVLMNHPDDPMIKNYVLGFSYVYKNLLGVLENEGVSEIAPQIGDKFDPKSMEAVEALEDEGEENIVLKVNLNGYKLHDRLIRPARVVVSKKIENNQLDENKPE